MAESTVTVVATKRDTLDPYINILQNRSNDIDISFSSYLEPNNNEQQELEDTDQLSIFEARSYFSESKSNDRFNGSRFSSVGHAASSEASWNSQTGLLNRHESNRDERGSSKKGGSRWFFRRRTCPCSSSKSVQVKETKPRIGETRTGSDRVISNRIVHHHHQMVSSSDPIRLTIPSNTVTRSIESSEKHKNPIKPVLNQIKPLLNPIKPVLNPINSVLNPINPVLNPINPVLHPIKPVQNQIKPVLNPVKPVLDPIKPVLDPIKPVLNLTSPNGITTEEEATSDASSDLFEIESFSTQPAIRPWAPPVRNSIDESHETDTEYGYEPSEASVTWSVTTAEPVSAVASNFTRIGLSMAFSDCDKRRTGLLSCRCEKAVMVSGGERLMQPVKSVCVQDEINEKVLCNNGSSKLSLTSKPMPNTKSSFLV